MLFSGIFTDGEGISSAISVASEMTFSVDSEMTFSSAAVFSGISCCEVCSGDLFCSDGCCCYCVGGSDICSG